MPAFFLPPLELPIVPQATVSQSQVYEVDEEFRVEYQEVEQNYADGKLTFRGEVRLFYGFSVVRCDELVLDFESETGAASGNLSIVDPEGRIEANNMTFDWSEDGKRGTAYGALVKVGYLKVQGAEVRVEPGHWVVYDASFTLEDLERGRTKVTSSEVDILLGKRVKANHVYFHVLGQKLGPAPYVTINLDRRVTGLKLPSVALRSDGRVGLEWSATTLLSDQTALAFRASSFPGERPSYSAYYVYSPLDPEISQATLAPTSDLNERFTDGWFNHVRVRTPEQERATLTTKERSYAVGAAINENTRGRRVEEKTVSKAVDLVFQIGGENGEGFGYKGGARLQRIQGSANAPWIDRVVSGGTVSVPPLEFSSFLKGVARFDGQAFFERG